MLKARKKCMNIAILLVRAGKKTGPTVYFYCATYFFSPTTILSDKYFGSPLSSRKNLSPFEYPNPNLISNLSLLWDILNLGSSLHKKIKVVDAHSIHSRKSGVAISTLGEDSPVQHDKEVIDFCIYIWFIFMHLWKLDSTNKWYLPLPLMSTQLHVWQPFSSGNDLRQGLAQLGWKQSRRQMEIMP